MCVCHNKTNGYYVYQLFIVLNIFFDCVWFPFTGHQPLLLLRLHKHDWSVLPNIKYLVWPHQKNVQYKLQDSRARGKGYL